MRLAMRWLDRASWLAFTLLIVVIFGGCAPTQSTAASTPPGRSKTGSGLFLLDFAANGQVAAVHILKSTGSAKLDDTTIKTFKKWRAKPGVKQVKVPVTYTLQGASL